MAIYIPKPEPIEVYRWWKNGDAPRDGVINGINSGSVVGRHPTYGSFTGAMHCPTCGIAIDKHGVIIQRMGDLEYTLCPGDWLRVYRDQKKRIVGYSTLKNKVIEEYYIDLATVPVPPPEKPSK